jgi:hypothetical protein
VPATADESASRSFITGRAHELFTRRFNQIRALQQFPDFAAGIDIHSFTPAARGTPSTSKEINRQTGI